MSVSTVVSVHEDMIIAHSITSGKFGPISRHRKVILKLGYLDNSGST